MQKRYDLILSYSPEDRDIAHRLARDLEKRKLKVWYDRWEMHPGDRLQDKVKDGIRGSKYFLAVLSSRSVSAPWVTNELDSAINRELESKAVTVVPLLAGEVKDTEIPKALGEKNVLDFRDPSTYQGNIDRIVALFDSEKRKRRQYLAGLRAGATKEADPITALTRLACEYGDQTVQKAALAGLSKHSSPMALVGVARRMLDSWGVSASEYSIGVAGELWERGGLILLSSTLFYDNRFIDEKLDQIRTILERTGDHNSLGVLEKLDDIGELFRDPTLVDDWIDTIMQVENEDIRQGMIFGSKFEGTVGWQGRVARKPRTKEAERAVKYVESRIPGLSDLYEELLRIKR